MQSVWGMSWAFSRPRWLYVEEPGGSASPCRLLVFGHFRQMVQFCKISPVQVGTEAISLQPLWGGQAWPTQRALADAQPLGTDPHQTHSTPVPWGALSSTHWAHQSRATQKAAPSSPYPPHKRTGEVASAKICNVAWPWGHLSPASWGATPVPGWGATPVPGWGATPVPSPVPEPSPLQKLYRDSIQTAANPLGKVLGNITGQNWCTQVSCFCVISYCPDLL